MSVPLFTDRRRFLAILAAGGLLLFGALALLPGSPGHDRPGTWLAVGISVANLAAAWVLRRIRSGPHHLLVFSSVLAVTAALSDSDPGRASDMYLLWYPWIAGYGAMVPRLRTALGHAVLISAGVVLGLTFQADPVAAVPLIVMTAVTVLSTALVVFWFARWSEHLVDRDPLTRLANRAGLVHGAQPAIATALAADRHAVLVLLDINRFREVNDALGHPAGDRLLQALADRLRGVTAGSGVAAESCFAGRLGSDEFAVVMCGFGLPDDPDAANEQMHATGRMVVNELRGPFRIDGVDVEVEASAGVAVAPLHGASIDALLPAADAALHKAKRDGERVGVWDPGMAGVRPWELALHAQLRAAITDGELVLYYQPLLSARTGRIAGVEALLRWAHPTRGLLTPAAFLPMAERSTLIIDVTEWVLDEALRQCADWASAGHHIPVSVNLSARMLVRGDLPTLVSGTLARHGLPADVLTLEITESALVTQPTRAATMLRELRTHGVKLSLDDFGTGYSSMEILKALPFDEVKIDRGFVSDAHGSLPDVAIVRSVLELGHRLGLRVVGEGVEDSRALRMLMELGCDILQGEAISCPLPPSPELLAMLTAGTSTVLSEPGRHRAATSGRPTTSGRGHLSRTGTVVRSVPPRSIGSGPAAPVPADEAARVAALHRYEILDSAGEAAFDGIAALGACLCDTPIGFVAFLDGDREWFKARYGTTLAELPRDKTVSQYALTGPAVFEVPDIAADPRFMRMATIGPNRSFRFYAGAPIVTPDGHVIGHVIVIDRIPRTLTPGQKESLAALGRQTTELLEARRADRILGRTTTALAALEQLWYPDDLHRAVTTVTRACRTLLDADTVSLLLADLPGSTVFQAVGCTTRSEREPAIPQDMRFTENDSTGIGAVLRTRAPVFVADVPTSQPLPFEAVPPCRTASALIVPIPGEGGLIGLVVAGWAARRDQADSVGLRAVTLLAGQAGHALARLRKAQARIREGGIDPATSLTSRDGFLATLQGLPAGTVVCLFAVPGGGREEASISEGDPPDDRERILSCFAHQLRSVAGPGVELARWSRDRFVAAFPGGSRARADDMIMKLRVVWNAGSMPPFAVGTATTGIDQPPSAALSSAEGSLRDALRTAGSPHPLTPTGPEPGSGTIVSRPSPSASLPSL